MQGKKVECGLGKKKIEFRIQESECRYKSVKRKVQSRKEKVNKTEIMRNGEFSKYAVLNTLCRLISFHPASLQEARAV